MPTRKKVTYSSKSTHAARAAHARGDRQFRTYDTSQIMPKRSKGPVVFGVIVVLLIIGVMVFLFNSCSGGSNATKLADGEQATVTIDEGSGTSAIASELSEAGVVSNSRDFTNKVSNRNVESSLKPGTYTFVGGMTIDDVIDELVNGPGMGATLVIPEGYTLEKTAQAVADAYNGKITKEDFTKAANSASTYAAEFPFVAGAYNGSLEGFLFPKTYEVDDSATADTVVRQMLQQFKTETAGIDYSKAKAAGLSEYDVLKLASIIEKEADDSNRAKVSSVFYNRLAENMPLQSDATVAYIIGDDPTPEDLKKESPYNTYLNSGLPAGPICTPGIDCLEAAANPEDTDYLYFYFQEKNGKMEYSFSETYEEHQDAIDS